MNRSWRAASGAPARIGFAPPYAKERAQWLATDLVDAPSDKQLKVARNLELQATANSVSKVKTYLENYPDGRKRFQFSGGIGDDGRFLLHGPETWYYPDGTTQRQADYDKGRKVGAEKYLSRDGRKIWIWEHKKDGSSTWTQYWPTGRKKASARLALPRRILRPRVLLR